MDSIELKNNLHNMIDKTSDENLLDFVYRLFKSQTKTLSEEQEKELMLAYEESFDNENLISSIDFLEQNKKWQ